MALYTLNILIGHSFSVNALHLYQILSLYSDTDTDSVVTFDEVLQNSIDMKNRMHKFAILDISQRLRANKWQTLAGKLEIPNTTIQQLTKTENVVEERYYKLFREWLNCKREAATFAVLRDILETCDLKIAVDIIFRRRLIQHNETL